MFAAGARGDTASCGISSCVETEGGASGAVVALGSNVTTSFHWLREGSIRPPTAGRCVNVAILPFTAAEDALGATTAWPGIPQHGGETHTLHSLPNTDSNRSTCGP